MFQRPPAGEGGEALTATIDALHSGSAMELHFRRKYTYTVHKESRGGSRLDSYSFAQLFNGYTCTEQTQTAIWSYEADLDVEEIFKSFRVEPSITVTVIVTCGTKQQEVTSEVQGAAAEGISDLGTYTHRRYNNPRPESVFGEYLRNGCEEKELGSRKYLQPEGTYITEMECSAANVTSKQVSE